MTMHEYEPDAEILDPRCISPLDRARNKRRSGKSPKQQVQLPQVFTINR